MRMVCVVHQMPVTEYEVRYLQHATCSSDQPNRIKLSEQLLRLLYEQLMSMIVTRSAGVQASLLGW